MKHWMLIIFLFPAVAIAQPFGQWMKMGQEALGNGNPHLALAYFDKAMEQDSASVDANYYYAETMRLVRNYSKAEWYYQKVYDKTKGRLYPEAVYWLAVMQKMNGNYRESGKTWRKVTRILGKDKESYYYLKSRREQQSCRWAYSNYRRKPEHPSNVLTGTVNTYDAEFAPWMTGDTLYFTAVRTQDKMVHTDASDATRIYQATIDGNAFSSEALLEVLNLKDASSGNVVISPDGNRLYLTQYEKDGGAALFVSWREGDSWGNPEKIGGSINNGTINTQPHIALIDDEEYLFFASDRAGGKGGLDIWYATIRNGNEYSDPINAGEVINSPDNEVTPFYDPEKNALYFSSEWHDGLGGYDIHYALGKPGGFDKVKNAGTTFNTSWNDLYYRKFDNTILVTSNRRPSEHMEDGTCCNDIYRIDLPEPPADTVETLESLMEYLPVTLYFHNDRPNPNSIDTTTQLNYLTTYDRYKALQSEYRKEYSSGLRGDDAQDARADIDDFFDYYVNKGVDDLYKFTNLLHTELDKGLAIEITIQGFASPLAATDYNVNLTKRRVSSLQNFLREYENGILMPYLVGTAENGGSLEFVTIPFGEYTADLGISDNPNDQKNSIYSRKAALERKIEIQKVELVDEERKSFPKMTFDSEIRDFGVLTTTADSLVHTFRFTNTGQSVLKIDSVETSCECMVPEFSTYSVEPGNTGEVQLSVDPSGFKNKTVVKLILHTNGIPEKKELMVTFEVRN